jgi:hypothetical protein
MYWEICKEQSTGGCTPEVQDVTVPLLPHSLGVSSHYLPHLVSTESGFAWRQGFVTVTRDSWHGYVAVNQIGSTGEFTVATSTSATGPFTPLLTATAPCKTVTYNVCRAFVYHPELSTRSTMVISYFNPRWDGPQGHEMVATVAM